ncbi:MAG: hypothetical protein JNL62_21310 [Bryobacterales bacterium]|nr:hypothetical protein [Bryobacterales bacterium]
MIWLRNTIALQIFLACVFAVILVLPRFYAAAIWHWGDWRVVCEGIAALGLQATALLLSYAAAMNWEGIVGERDAGEQRKQWCEKSEKSALEQHAALLVFVVNLAMVIWAALYSVRLYGVLSAGESQQMSFACRFAFQVGDSIFPLALFSLGYSRGVRRGWPAVVGLLAILATNPIWFAHQWPVYAGVLLFHWSVLLALVKWGGNREKQEAWQDFWRAVLAAVASVLVAYGGVHAIYAVFSGEYLSLIVGNGKWFWHFTMFAWPALLAVFAFSLVVMMAMAGRAMPDLVREAWSRLGAGLGVLSAGIVAVTGFAIYSPRATEQLHGAWTDYLAGAGGGIAALVSIISFFAAKSQSSSGRKESHSRMDMLASIAPVAFIIFLMGAVSFAVHCALAAMHGCESDRWLQMRESIETMGPILALSAGALAVAGILAWRVDINEFSLNRFYRNRLVRCFVAAGRSAERHRNPFTGFDGNDDLQLGLIGKFIAGGFDSCQDGTLREATPIPIINTALNTVGGDDAVLTERRARSLFFTPFHVYANQMNGVALQETTTGRFTGDVTLGSAIAISGAAANPNMGFHSSPAIAFLLTFFNVRLGWWLRNANNPQKGGEHFTLFYLFRELFGWAEDDDVYVNISDGGHFDNLGLYELIRRECDLIIVGDGEEDKDYVFESLGMAIRRCRVDFEAEIEIDVSRIRPKSEGAVSDTHFAIGWIKYKSNKKGVLVYLKSSVTGEEPYDVEQYRRRNPAFPHQSTGDQFFSESQFESYRQVGMTAAEEMWRRIDAGQIQDRAGLLGAVQHAARAS